MIWIAVLIVLYILCASIYAMNVYRGWRGEPHRRKRVTLFAFIIFPVVVLYVAMDDRIKRVIKKAGASVAVLAGMMVALGLDIKDIIVGVIKR